MCLPTCSRALYEGDEAAQGCCEGLHPLWCGMGGSQEVVDLVSKHSMPPSELCQQPCCHCHCSAGCGRTGVICAIDYTQKLLRDRVSVSLVCASLQHGLQQLSSSLPPPCLLSPLRLPFTPSECTQMYFR